MAKSNFEEERVVLLEKGYNYETQRRESEKEIKGASKQILLKKSSYYI